MIKKLLPLVLLLIGAGAGVGAGIFMRPAPSANMAGEASTDSAQAGEKDEHADTKEAGQKADDHGDDHGAEANAGDTEFVKMSNQFVVPIVANGRVGALVVLGLSIEVPGGKTDAVYERQPKLRDSFLQVLFDHANMGGFDGAFTDAKMLGRLREALRDVARRDAGTDAIQDVLIVEIARQDY